ncbi:MAG: hypothetical protein LUH14_10835 [Clostridiaceae bacterium]|nr:hypothetical protein [Clostridiaceae bacterium]
MKKRVSVYGLLLAVCLLFSACGTDPVAEELRQFANEDMSEVTEKYQSFVSDYLDLAGYSTDPQEYADYIKETLLTDLESISEDLDNIETESSEITDLKEKYRTFIDGYYSAFQKLAEAAEEEDSESQKKAVEEIDNGAEALEAYNTALQELADKYDIPVVTAPAE